MKRLKEEYPDVMTMDGYDDAIIGVVERIGLEVVCYDLDKVIEILMKQGMDEEDAWEWYQFNMVGSWVGEKTPVFLQRFV
jgi:hypothetical protein|tara:strand:+ start:319 stop:558 length:240 start_codon:yes stop_codon:yes gene_type:complete